MDYLLWKVGQSVPDPVYLSAMHTPLPACLCLLDSALDSARVVEKQHILDIGVQYFEGVAWFNGIFQKDSELSAESKAEKIATAVHARGVAFAMKADDLRVSQIHSLLLKRCIEEAAAKAKIDVSIPEGQR